MTRRLAHFEQYGDFRIKGLLPFEIFSDEKNHAMHTGFKLLAPVKKLRDAAVTIGRTSADFEKPPATGLPLQNNPHALRRQTLRGVQNMGTDSAHNGTSLSKRRRVILSCSSAATRISVSGGFASRDFRMDSISSAYLPLAQTMKM